MSDINSGRDYSVISVTNITKEPFAHKYEGVEYRINAGETLFFPAFLARHLAKHLTKRILTREFKSVPPNSGRAMPTERDPKFKQLMNKLLGDEVRRPATEQEEELNALQKEVEEINQEMGTKEKPKSKFNGMTKNELITECRKRGIKLQFGVRNAEMLEMLEEFEAIADATGRKPDGTALDTSPEAPGSPVTASEEEMDVEPVNTSPNAEHDIKELKTAAGQ